MGAAGKPVNGLCKLNITILALAIIDPSGLATGGYSDNPLKNDDWVNLGFAEPRERYAGFLFGGSATKAVGVLDAPGCLQQCGN